jgi:molybdopterin-guanine dinucleotide biosynthesis protein
LKPKVIAIVGGKKVGKTTTTEKLANIIQKIDARDVVGLWGLEIV